MCKLTGSDGGEAARHQETCGLQNVADVLLQIGLGIHVLPVELLNGGNQVLAARAAAQGCADAMVRGGVKAIWNFAPVHLSAPPGVLVQRENMASSLALLSYHLRRAEEGLPDEQA